MVKISFIGLSSSEALVSASEYAESKFEKLSKNISSVQTVFSYKRGETPANHASFSVAIKGGLLHSEASSKDIYHAISEATDKMETQINTHEEKLRKKI